jgi:hypothetical protein
MEVINLSGDPKASRDFVWPADLLEQGPRAGLPAAGARVCQACGQLGTFEGLEGEAAGHVHGGEFVGYSPGHAQCEFSPFPAYLRRRPYRYCEVCRTRVSPEDAERASLYWLCRECAGRISDSGHRTEGVLRDLELRRFASIGAHAPHRGVGPALKEEPELGDVITLEPILPPAGWLPLGLSVCDRCGTVRGSAPAPLQNGTVGRLESSCLCEGPRCRGCGRKGRRRRPISNYYDRSEASWIHVPHFVGFVPLCDECRAAQS